MSPPTSARAHVHLARHARERPSDVACVDIALDDAAHARTRSPVCWLELSARVDALAGRLSRRGGRVLSACAGGTEALVCLLACGKVGRAIVSVDARAWPVERLAAAATATGATTTALTDGSDDGVVDVLRRVMDDDVDVIDVNAPSSTASTSGRDDDRMAESDADEWFVSFTSGTTGGGLKAIANTHARAMAYGAAKARVEELSENSRVCLASNATFDLYPGDVAAAMLSGSAVVVASREVMQRDLARVLTLGDVTHVCCTPTIFSLNRAMPEELPKLRCVSLAGEKMSLQTLERWAPAVSLYNVYGATETTVVQTYARMRGVDDDPSRAGVAYEKFAFVRIVERFEPNASGVAAFASEPGFVGEIAIGGPCVCDGYENDRERTNAMFVSSPLGRVYLTGDRGSIDASGDLFLCGRNDRQVKIRGHRMELDDIESVARSFPELADDAVVFYEDGVLTAHVRISSPRYRAEDADLYSFALERVVERRLPAYAVPRRIVLIPRDEWPLTSSGKTNRPLLKSWLESGRTLVFRPERTPPEPGLETILAEAWARALGFSEDGGISGVGALDAFDALGGNSINVLAVSRALEGDARLAFSTESSNSSRPRDENHVTGLHVGEAAALLRQSGDEPAACAFGHVDGPFAPCEILARPVLRDYAAYLRSRGVDVCGWCSASAAAIDLAPVASRRLLAACGRGVAPVVSALLSCGVQATARCLGAAAASSSEDADIVVNAILERGGVDIAIEASNAGTLATHIAAARGHASILIALLKFGAPPGARDADKQTILHLAVRGGDAETIFVAAKACKQLRTRKGGLEAWDRWKRTAAAWALLAGDAQALAILRDAGAELTSLEADVGSRWVHGTLSAKSKVQMANRPERKRAAERDVMRTLIDRLDDDDDERRAAAGAIRELVCANAENRASALVLGAVPKLCALIRKVRCLDAMGALRNLASHTASAIEAGNHGAMEALGDIIRDVASDEDKRVMYVAASAMRALASKSDANAERLARASDVAEIVARMCDGMKL